MIKKTYTCLTIVFSYVIQIPLQPHNIIKENMKGELKLPMTLQEKLSLWVKITGVDPSEEMKSYTIKLDGKMSTYDIKKMNDRIMESLKYDTTGLFADAYLGVYFEDYIKDRTFTLSEIINNPDVKKYIKDIEALNSAIKDSNSTNEIMAEASKAMDFYELKHDQLDIFDIVELRTSAMRCMDGKLRVLQFSSGTPSVDGFKMSKDIYMYRDINALLLSAANNTLNGVSLGYIRNSEMITDSYFAFIVKNGQNLYLLTDMPKYKHPVQNKMSRCPGRNMSDRINVNFFPYETVANIDTSDLWGNDRYGTNEKSMELSTVLNEDAARVKIGVFETMDQQEAFWSIMMISLIQEKYYKDIPQYEISYVGSMIQNHQIAATETALTIRSSLPIIELGDVSIEDTIDLEYEGYKELSGLNDYLITRYKKDIDKDALNLIDGTDRFEVADEKYTVSNSSWHNDKTHLLVPFDLNTCGTKEELEYNQKWVERYNYAEQIKVLAKADYDGHAGELLNTVEQMVTPRIREIVKMHFKNQTKSNRSVHTASKGFGTYENKEVVFSKIHTFDHWYDGLTSSTFMYGYNRRSNKADMKCAFTSKTPCVVVKIEPGNIDELAMVCGCKVTDFPERLQHWTKKDVYYGNPILSNIDPMIWKINDPFNDMLFNITILISKKEYLTICEEEEIIPDKLWETVKPLCHRSEKEDACRGSYKQDYTGIHVKNILLTKCLKCLWYKENRKSDGGDK